MAKKKKPKAQKTITIKQAEKRIHYLLNDWGFAIKRKSIVIHDIVSRFKKVRLPRNYKTK